MRTRHRRSPLARKGTSPAPHPTGSVPTSSEIDLPPPPERPLRAYAFDPSQGRLLGNEMSVPARYQELDPGPVVRDFRAHNAIAVVDYDGAARCWYAPVDLDDPRILIRGGLDPSECDPRFHQQMVYAVATETIQAFETALGRQIHWRRGERVKGSKTWVDEDIYTLYLYPHAMWSANAFYSPRTHGILFGYFRAQEDDPGRNLPGQIVYTCLSHDIIVHELTHAIVDGVRSHFTEATNPDVAAFHEAFADLAALFRHFAHRDTLQETIERTGGALHRYYLQPEAGALAGAPDAPPVGEEERNPLVELAQQFGEARGMGRGLRQAIGSKPDPDALRSTLEPHRRGSILVAAVFDAYFSIYLRQVADLFRILRADGGNTAGPNLPSPMARRLAYEAGRTAEIFFTLCVRALDYFSPLDPTFGDFLRAVVTADFDLHPMDELGIRDAFMQAFRRRGIYPQSATSFSEAAIAWPRASWMKLPPVTGLDFGDPNGLTNTQQNWNRRALRAYFDDPENRKKLLLDPKLPVDIPSFHPVYRVSPDGALRTDMVVEVVQRREAPFLVGNPGFGSFPLRGGATVILSRPTISEVRSSATAGATVRYVIGKRIDGQEGAAREEQHRQHFERMGLMEGTDPGRFQVDFAMVHGGF